MNSKILKIFLLILTALVIWVALSAARFKCDTEAKRIYTQGMGFFYDKNYSDAYYNFKQIKKFSKLYPLALLKQFQCANYLSDKKTAHLKIAELAKSTNDENLKPFSLYNEANLALELNFDTQDVSLKKYKYIYNHYPDSDFGLASAYKIARLSTNNGVKKEKYIEYLDNIPNGKFALSALSAIEEEKLILNKQDKEIVAGVYLENKKYKQALDYYLETDFRKNWYKISKCYRGLERKDSEKETILKGLNLEKSSVEEKEIDWAIDRLTILSNSSKIQLLQNLYKKYPNSYIYPTVLYKLAESSGSGSVRGIKLYEYIVEKYPDSIWASNSLWELFWYNYKLSRFQLCEDLAKKHYELYPKTQDAPRVQYWYARALANEKKPKEALEVFYKVIKNYPLSYYAFLSTKQSREIKKHDSKNLFIKNKIFHGDYLTTVEQVLFKDELLIFLSEQGDYQAIDELRIKNEYIDSWVANKKRNFPLSIKMAKDKFLTTIKEQNDYKPDFSSYELKLIYPIVYENEINRYCERHGISPYLFLSLVREESHFDKNSKSAVGAIGLAQVMPSTAEFIEKRPISTRILHQEEENIEIGVKYFAYLLERFEENEYLAILAYNAGPGKIDRWLKNDLISSDEIDVFVENIPYIETKNYIKKILSSYWVYLNVYRPQKIRH